MHQRTRPIRLVFLAVAMAAALVSVAPATTSVTRAQDPQTYLYEYRGPLPDASLQSLSRRVFDIHLESGAVTPISGTIEILVEETVQDLEETEDVETVLTRFEASAEIVGELRELQSPASEQFAAIAQPCQFSHWRWGSDSVDDHRLTNGGKAMRLSVFGLSTLSHTRPDCASLEPPMEGGTVVTFKLFRGDQNASYLACAWADDLFLEVDDVDTMDELLENPSPEVCMASAVKLSQQN
jgi:hypothetical protein